ncbi:MAG: tetratricopeptide repeat protein [Eubacterium sp.]|nr:tetratricopeptide repeat protein [Eubacterium sp.]
MEEHSRKEASQLSLKAFIYTFLSAGKNNRRYCFILGSGASREAGILTGVEMAKQWAGKLKEKYEENELKELMRKLEIDSIEPNSKNYFGIYDLLYHDDYQEGYAYFERELEKGTPSLGHYALAKILAGERHNLVITTNFDSLVEDALFIYTRKHPLVIGHESLTEFMNLNINRPVVAKIHRSLYFHPFNRQTETNDLAAGWKEILESLFMVYTPVVIGYAGGDQSLMQFLNDKKVKLNGLYWCYWSKEEPSQEIKDLVAEKNGCLIPIEGFDQMMFMISRKLGFDNPEEEIRQVTEERIEKYNKQYREFETRMRDEADKESVVKDTIHDTIKEIDSYNKILLQWAEIRLEKEESAENYNYRGNIYVGLDMYDKAIADYTKALEKNPECAEAYYNRGNAYAEKGENDKAIADYTKFIEKKPEYAQAYYNRGYAHVKKGEYDKAIADYTKAVEKNPESAEAY